MPGTLRVPRRAQPFYTTKNKVSQKRYLVFGRGFKDLTEAAKQLLTARRPKFFEFQYPPSRSALKTVYKTVFLTRRPSRVQVLFYSEQKTPATKVTGVFWQGQKDLTEVAEQLLTARRPKFFEFQYPPSRSALKTVYKTVFLTRRPSRVQVLFYSEQKTPATKVTGVFWQGQKDLNPRHAVLETAALPTELYPYIINWWAIRDSNPGPSGYEPDALTN